MIKIEITTAEVRTKAGVSARTGKPYNIREQDGYAHTHDRQGKLNPYPVRLAISLGDDQPPYPPGIYTLLPESLYTNRFNQLEISPVLKPLQPAQPAHVAKAA
jgi:hypothetical protein